MQLQSLTEILGINNYKVTKILFNDEKTLKLYIDRIEKNDPVCSSCGDIHAKIHSEDVTSIEDLSISGKRVFLIIKKRKIFCDNTFSIRVEEVDWIKGRTTKRFAEHVYRLTLLDVLTSFL